MGGYSSGYSVGSAAGADLVEVAHRACDEALRGLGGRPPVLAVVWVSGEPSDLVERALAEAAELLQAEHVVGCSTSGVLAGPSPRAVEDGRAVAVWLSDAPGLRVRTFHLEVIGDRVVGMPLPSDDEQVALLLADPWSFPTEGWVEALAEVSPTLRTVGGLASGGGAGDTRLLVDGAVHGRGAVGLLLGGEVVLRTVVSQGCRPVGPPMTVTGSDGGLLTSLASMPATAKLQQVLAALSDADREVAAEGLQIGIAMDELAEEPDPSQWLVRPVVGVDPERAGVAVAEHVPVGTTVRLMVRDAEGATADLVHAAGQLDGCAAAWLVTCNGRGTAMFPSPEHDVAVLGRELGDVPVAGFFAGGELGCVHGHNRLLGFTASVLAFGEGGS